MLMKPAKYIFGVWGLRWNVLRWLIAGLFLWTFIIDNPARLARMEFAALPDYDYVSEVRHLREQGQFGEALVIADAGLEVLGGSQRVAVEEERAKVLAERDSYLRRLRDFGHGAVTGSGETTEALLGAITTDLFLVGDIRDIIIQGSRYLTGGETDTLILTLSAVGVLTTVVPEVDWVSALLKIAKKTGALGIKLSESILKIGKKALANTDYSELRLLTSDVAALSKRASPEGTIRLLRAIDDPQEISTASRFVNRYADGAFALHVTGKDGIRILQHGTADADDLLRAVAKKGERGAEWLRSGKINLLRPHPIVGFCKAFYKGNPPTMLQRLVSDYLDPYSYILIPLLAVWFLGESGLFTYRVRKLYVNISQSCLCYSSDGKRNHAVTGS